MAVTDDQLPTQGAEDDITTTAFNAMTAHRRILGKIRVAHVSGDQSANPVLEQEIHEWRTTWPGSNDDQAAQNYAQLLSLQALCLLYRPTTALPEIKPAQLDKLGKYAKEALTIYQNSTSHPRGLPALAWRYQIVITLLYTIMQTDNTDVNEIQILVDSCRQVISGESGFKELEKMSQVFERLSSEILLGETGPGRVDTADRLLAELHSPREYVEEREEQDGERAMRVLEAKESRAEMLWDHLI